MLKLENISKSYGDVLVLDDINLEIRPNSFVAFLGPSGCGKTTLLRLIAGLIDPSKGQISLTGQRIDNLPAAQRDVAMVFQNYALYPHMTIYDNLAFGLRNMKVDRQEIESRIKNALRILEIEQFANKKPSQLSGGQRQRVAIGRAIVKNPKIFLFDEPLSNLDASLRVRTRIELAELHKRMNAIMILVTHDQIEAMTLADMVVVLNENKIQQIGSPIDIYTKPKNKFVASFVGTPEINYFAAKISNNCGKINATICGRYNISLALNFDKSQNYLGYEIGLRPEAMRKCALSECDLKGEIEFIERLGDRSILFVILEGKKKIRIQDEGNSTAQIGEKIGIKIAPDGAILFDKTGQAFSYQAEVG